MKFHRAITPGPPVQSARFSHSNFFHFRLDNLRTYGMGLLVNQMNETSRPPSPASLELVGGQSPCGKVCLDSRGFPWIQPFRLRDPTLFHPPESPRRRATGSPFHPLTHSPTHPLTHSPTHPLTHSPTHPLTHPPTHPLTHSPTHPLTHSPTHPLTLPSTRPPLSYPHASREQVGSVGFGRICLDSPFPPRGANRQSANPLRQAGMPAPQFHAAPPP